jgi:hypothetical protein
VGFVVCRNHRTQQQQAYLQHQAVCAPPSGRMFIKVMRGETGMKCRRCSGMMGESSPLDAHNSRGSPRRNWVHQTKKVISVCIILIIFVLHFLWAELIQTFKHYFSMVLLTYSMVQDIIRKADCHSTCQKISCFLMELEGSLPCSHKPAPGPYPEPAECSSPHRSLSP